MTLTLKKTLIFTCFLLAAGCSSAKKQAETQAPAAMPAASAAAPTATEAAPKAAHASHGSGLKKVECKKKGDDRKLEIVDKDGGCELLYTKQGATQTLASQKTGTHKCDEVLDRIHKRLETSGYECNG